MCSWKKWKNEKKNERGEKWSTTLLRKLSTIDIQNSKYKKIKKIKLSSHRNNFVSRLPIFNTYGIFDYALHKWQIRKLTNHKEWTSQKTKNYRPSTTWIVCCFHHICVLCLALLHLLHLFKVETTIPINLQKSMYN